MTGDLRPYPKQDKEKIDKILESEYRSRKMKELEKRIDKNIKNLLDENQ